MPDKFTIGLIQMNCSPDPRENFAKAEARIREAAKRGIQVQTVEVTVEGNFGAEGEPAKDVAYQAKVTARASEAEVRELMKHTDLVAEIQNTLRVETPVVLTDIEVVT